MKKTVFIKIFIFVVVLGLFCSCEENTTKSINCFEETVEKIGAITEISDDLLSEDDDSQHQADLVEKVTEQIEDEYRKMMGVRYRK